MEFAERYDEDVLICAQCSCSAGGIYSCNKELDMHPIQVYSLKFKGRSANVSG